MGEVSRGGGGPGPPLATDALNSNNPGQSGTTSAWAGGAGLAGNPHKQRTFAEIIADQKQNRNILEITFTKIPQVDSTGNVTKHRNLNFDEIGSFLFDTLKLSPSECLRFNYATGRFDTKEVMFKPDIDISKYLGTFEFMEHEVTTKRQLSNVTKITFKNVPLNIPDEEIVNLCETYGKPIDYVVHYEKLNNVRNKGMIGGTRFMEVELFPGACMNNFYWMEGPLSGDTGCRVTVLHPGQVQQCSNCLRLANLGCPGKGNGRACEALKTHRATMTTYMEFLKAKHGYRSLKSKYYEQFPYLGGAGNCGISDMSERIDDGEGNEGIRPINPIEEKDQQISELKKALADSKKEVSDITVVKENLHKAKSELLAARRSSSLARNKLDFARKVTEQRMSNCLSQASGDLEEELVALYSTLVDEDNFNLEDDTITPVKDFLKAVEDKVVERGEIPDEIERLTVVKNKILEKVKMKKIDRSKSRERNASTSSLRSISSKRSSGEPASGEHKSRKTGFESSLPLPSKAQ